MDVIERVLGGVQVTTTDGGGPRTSTFDLGPREWFGVRRSSVEVTYAPVDEKPPRDEK